MHLAMQEVQHFLHPGCLEKLRNVTLECLSKVAKKPCDCQTILLHNIRRISWLGECFFMIRVVDVLVLTYNASL